MKKLFKNSFKSFLQSKGAMILLAFIVLLTTTVYTMLSSFSFSYKKSYDDVVTSSNLHDFTVKEKYMDGELKFNVSQPITSQTLTENKTMNGFSDDLKYIYLSTADLPAISGTNMVDPGSFKSSPQDVLIRIPRSSFSISDSNSDGVIDDKDKTAALDNDKKITFEMAAMNDNPSKASDLFTSTDLLRDAKTVQHWYKAPDLKFEKRSDPRWNTTLLDFDSLSKGGFQLKWASDVLFNGLKNQIKSAIISKNYWHFESSSAVKLTLDPQKSTGIYHTLLNGNADLTPSLKNLKDKINNEISDLGYSSNAPIQFLPQRTKADGTKVSIKVENAEQQITKNLKQIVDGTGRENFLHLVDKKYGNVLDHKLTESINISDKGRNFKIVNAIDNDQKINTLHRFSGFPLPSPISDEALGNILKAKVAKTGMNGHFEIDKSKHFKYAAHWTTSIFGHKSPHAETSIDPASYFAEVSPGYFDAHHLKSVNPDWILKNKATADTFNKEPGKIFALYPDSVVEMGMTKFLVIGSAIQPDFSFPIIDAQNPIPNTKSQAILFTSPNGYKRAVDSYRNNTKETYLSFDFKNKLSDDEQDKVMAGVEDIAKSVMSWPGNIKIATKANDTTEMVILAPQRITFLQKLKTSISTVSILTTTMLILFVAFIVYLVVKKQINSKRKMFGILLANGYSKNQIALSNISIALIVGLISTTIGYFIGLGLQIYLSKVFSDYWTLPVTLKTFSWEAIIITVVAPMVGIGLLSYVITRWELRGRLVDILNDSIPRVSGALSLFVLRGMRWFGIQTRVSVSIFTSNISKMIMVFFSATISIIVIAVAFTTVGRFEYANTKSLALSNYEFKVNFESPTAEGGLLHYTTPVKAGGDWTKGTKGDKKSFFTESGNNANTSATWFVPSYRDEKLADGPKYLDNLLQIQSTLNVTLGSLGMGSNPWDSTVKKLIPEAQANTSTINRDKFLGFGLTLEENKDIIANNSWCNTIKKSLDDGNHIPNLGESINENTFKPRLTNAYKTFVSNTYSAIVNNYDKYSQYMPYIISYRNIIGDKSDETYTYISGKFNSKDIVKQDRLETLNIIGLKENSKMINLDSKLKTKLADYYKAHSNVAFSGSNPDAVPVVTNTYFNRVYNKHLGDSFEIDVNNMQNRFTDHGFGSQSVHLQKFVIVGEQESYNGSKVFTLQDIANKALGYDEVVKSNPSLYSKDDMFNGVFTSEKSPTIFKNLSLYSTSGLYPSADTIIPGSDSSKMVVAYAKNLDPASPLRKLLIPNGTAKNDEIVRNFVKLYSASPFVMTWSNVDWSRMAAYAFHSTLDLSSKIIWIIEMLALAISILFISIITIMLLSDNKKFISTLKVMGYREREISKIFFSSFIPAILVGMIVAIPLTFAVLVSIKLAIVGFGSILIPLSMIGWELLVAFAIVLLITGIIYYFSTRELKNASMLNAFK